MSKDKRLGRGLEALLGKVAAAQPNVATAAAFDPDVDEFDAETSSDAQESTDGTYPSIVAFPGQSDDEVVPSKRRSTKRSAAAEIEEEKDRALAQFSDGRQAVEIDVDLIDRNPYQPRLSFDADELEELKGSLEQHGMLQPIVVRQTGNRYEIVAGERRLRAARDVGWKRVPAILIVVDDRQMAELALTENMQRCDLNPIEKARAFKNYLDVYGGTHAELASRLALERSTVSNFMRLLDLAEEVQEMTSSGELSQGHARALISLEENDQIELAHRIVEERLSVRQTEEIVRDFLNGEIGVEIARKPSASIKQVSPHIQELENQFRAWLGMKIKLTSNDKGRGKLVIQFNSNDDFERIYQALKPRDF